jgi:TonB-linked SusC/RagA family outer membrane protein
MKNALKTRARVYGIFLLLFFTHAAAGFPRQISNPEIAAKPSSGMLATEPPETLAQNQLNIRGKITDQGGAPLPGVTVVVKGTTLGTVTGTDGNYVLAKIPDNATLVFSFVGMKTQEISVDRKTIINIVMQEEAIGLEEVIAIGYGTVKRKDLTGSVSSIKSEELVKSGAMDFSSAMQGRLPGVKINTQSGEAGSSVQVTIRGANSIHAGTEPLYVIDGMQIDVNQSEVATSGVGGSTRHNPLASINPNDIESIDVLKDASATAIYGSRGANGVILVTTKSGTSLNRTDINFDMNIGLNKNTKRIRMLNAQDFVNYKFLRGEIDGYGMDTDGDEVYDVPLDASQYEQYDWQDIMIRNGVTQNYNISANSIIRKTKIAASLDYFDQKGIILSNKFQRFTGRLKIDHEVNSKLAYGMTVNFGRNINDGAMSSGGSGTGGYTGLVQLIYTERPVKLYTETEGTELYPNGYTNLYTMATDEAYKYIVFSRLLGNAYVDYKLIPDLKLHLSASGNLSLSKLQEYYSSKSLWGRSYGGYGSIKNVNTDGYTLTGTVNYNKLFNKKHRINALVGVEMNGYHFENSNITARSFTDETTGVFDISKGSSYDLPTSNVTTVIRESLFFRVSYDYRSKYYATVNFRQDASSNFPENSRIGYFPSLSLAWRMSGEKFLSGLPWLNNLKFRASAGASGNDRISTYGALARMSTAYYGSDGTSLQGLVPSASENPKLKWETTYQYDLGLDLDLFKSRISFTGDVYYKDTRDMLFQTNVPAQIGFDTQWQNIGRLSNKGFELLLITRNIEKKDFSWVTSFSFDLNRNKVKSLGDVEYLPVSISNGFFVADVARVIKGKPIGTGYGYEFDGNYQLTDFDWTNKATGESVDPGVITSENINQYSAVLKEDVVSINSLSVKPGDRKYRNLNDDNTIDDKDRTVISHSAPKFNYGINSEFKFKNFDFSFFLEGVYGNEIMNVFKYQVESNNTLNMYNLTQDYFYNRWIPENPTNHYASLLSQANNFSSSYYVEDASFLRLKNVNLGYNFGKQLCKRWTIQSLRVYLTLENLFVITGYSGMDPDVLSTSSLFPGYDRLSYPRTRNYTLGISLTL